MIDELEWVKHARPDVSPPGDEARLAARAALEAAIAAEKPRRNVPRLRWGRPGRLAPIAALVVAALVVAVFLGVQGRKPSSPAARGGVELVYRALPTAQVPVVNHTAVARAVSTMRQRVATYLSPAMASAVTVSSAGDTIRVHLGPGIPIEAVGRFVGTTARLSFYDWEANVLAPSGKTVASELASQNPAALQISQGGATAAPGSPGAGSMDLYQAVTLAAKQPYEASKDNARFGPELFAFGAPGSAACSAAARHYIVPSAVGQHCYLAGPQDNLSDLASVLPPGVSLSHAQVLLVEQGTVVLQAIPTSYTHVRAWSDPDAQFFVLRDHVALFGNEITNPRPSTDQSGAPDVTFGFTAKGASSFQRLTAELAHRGAMVSSLGDQLDQHFAIALDDQLLDLPLIDYRTYPDGISGDQPAELNAGLTAGTAKALAAQLRLGWLPVNLKLISVSR